MTNEELVLQIQHGKDLYLQLWEQVERFITVKAADYFRSLEDGKRGLELEDLQQSGFLAMVDAARLYNPERGALFISYLSHHLHRHFSEAAGLRTDRTAADPINSKVSLDRPIEGENGETLGNLQRDPQNALEEAERRLQNDQLRARLEEQLAKLKPEDARAIRQKFFHGKTLTAIAEAEGVSISRIREREARGLRELRHPRNASRLEQFMEIRTPYYKKTTFRTTQTSPVESLVMLRERLRREYEQNEKRRRETGGKIWRCHTKA